MTTQIVKSAKTIASNTICWLYLLMV